VATKSALFDCRAAKKLKKPVMKKPAETERILFPAQRKVLEFAIPKTVRTDSICLPRIFRI
jgi:hypothetical protein